MKATILVTGGAGFIGSHLSRELLAAGYRVRVLDALDAQVHGGAARPSYLDPEIELVAGDVCDRETVRGAVNGVDMVCHLAAKAAVEFAAKGYPVMELDGGWRWWKDDGFEIEKS